MKAPTTRLHAAWTDPERGERLTGDADDIAQALRQQPPSRKHLLVHSVRWSLWPHAGLTRWADRPAVPPDEDQNRGHER